MLDKYGDSLQTLLRPPSVNYFLTHVLNPYNVSFCKRKHSVNTVMFHYTMQNERFCKHCHVRCHINWIQDFHLCILTHFFFWLNNGKVLTLLSSFSRRHKLSSLSGTKESDDDPEGTHFSWSFLMDHSWVLAMNHIKKSM